MTTAHHHEQDDVTVREIPRLRYGAIGWVVLVLVVVAMAAWELRMRSLGLRAGDLDDGLSFWTVERRKLDAGHDDGVVIFGSSRILFDTDLDAWEEMTGRRPIQLALVGTNPRPFLKRFAEDSDFSGLVVVGVTPELFFSSFTSAFPEFLGLNDLWRNESPSTRFGHQVGLVLSRYLAFLDDEYSLGKLVERIEVPDRKGVRRPYFEVWKLSEASAGRQHRMWRRLESDRRLQEHAVRVWLERDRGGPDDATIAAAIKDARQSVEKIRARGGDVVFVRAPSAGSLYEREARNVPRDRTWDRLVRETGSFGVHFEDYPEMQGLESPELSHLSAESATRFTRAYVELLRERYVWLRPGAVLHPGT
jgi:hypothetical protein